MEVKTENGGTFDAAGNGTKGLSIAGLVTGATALVGGGLLNLFGNGMGAKPDNKHNFVSNEQAECYAQIAELKSQLEAERSQRYTDNSIISYAKDKFDFNNEITGAIYENRSRIASLEQKSDCNKEISSLKEELLNQKICALQNQINSSIALEAERRMCGDQNVYNYANSTFVPGKLIMPASSICPQTMPLYNTWEAPTTTTTTGTTTS